MVRLGTLRAVSGAEGAAEGRLGSEHLEEVRGDQRAAQLLRADLTRQSNRAARPDARERTKCSSPFAKVPQIGTRHRPARVPERRLGRAGDAAIEPDEGKAIGSAVRERLEQHRVDHAEDCGVRPDAERKSGHDNRRQSWRFAETSPAVSQIDSQSVNCGPEPDPSDLFFDLRETASFRESAPARLIRRRTSCLVPRGQLVDPVRQLAIELAIERLALQYTAKPCAPPGPQ